ncbi:MAG: hypothetical protein I8N66_21480 [Ensifer sp. SSB1]|nr:hypothetical protein [Ensifer sp. SSB1]
MPSQPEALAQGPSRYARAKLVFDYAKRQAELLELAFNWKLVDVAGVGHDGAAMSRAAAAFWFEDRIPPVNELVFDDAVQL